MKASTIRKEIDKANKELQTLQTELPNFERLYRDNSEAEAKVKAAQRDGDDTLEDLSAARSRLLVSREMLEQHRSDISTLEATISDLQTRYEKQSAGERLAVAKEHHETLMTEYRDSIRHTLDAVQGALRAQLEKRGQVEARRQEITTLGLKLGIFERSRVTGSIRGAAFARLYPSVLPGLFDDSCPEVKSDRRVLELLEQLADVDEVVRQREPRQVLAHREATRQAQLREQEKQLQAEYQAMTEGTAV